MDDKVREFLESNHHAVMTTLRKDGTPHVARMDVGLVDGKLWSSGTQTRVRTKHLRRDPRAALAVLDFDGGYRWLGLDCRVTILEGEDAPELNLKLYRTIAKEPDDVAEYLTAMVTEQRLIYEFEIVKLYGVY
jgi:PPOX class probable F420-dependent enzyme